MAVRQLLTYTHRAGDAAHSFPPTGGLGLNCGLADVHNLAFKLALLHQDLAADSILDTYQTERRHVADIYSKYSIQNGKQIFSLLKSAGLADEKDAAIARSNLISNLANPSKKAEIDAGIEGQREHFDNLENHIGYTYSDHPIHPVHASHYIPKYTPGARLPHTWISFPSTTSVPLPLFPVDLSYIPDSELSPAEKQKRKYSTLDLVAFDAFTFLLGPAASQIQKGAAVNASKPYVERGLKVKIYQSGKDFDVIDGHEAAEKWATGAFGAGGKDVLLVRPDQHILSRFVEGSVSEDISRALRNFLGK